MWVEEKTHIHIVHDCRYSNRSCRCKWKEHPYVRRGIKRSICRPKFISEFSLIDWINVFIYFLLLKWKGRQEISINRTVRRLQGFVEDIRWQRLCEKSREILDRQNAGNGYRLNRHDPLWKDIKELFPKAAATLRGKGAALKKYAKSHPLY
ncbi:hypothetical protein AVEN_256141-1 [Araneus ventricosus]|uniref:Uncharacterized protein n=1 Tax=Araneus ventricosus TaxID=182803 RepID=A0A4Y2RBT9_ARAVE|nr:hypothetical protein AVEN_256141-1 [Araneus ventricosus]